MIRSPHIYIHMISTCNLEFWPWFVLNLRINVHIILTPEDNWKFQKKKPTNICLHFQCLILCLSSTKPLYIDQTALSKFNANVSLSVPPSSYWIDPISLFRSNNRYCTYNITLVHVCVYITLKLYRLPPALRFTRCLDGYGYDLFTDILRQVYRNGMFLWCSQYSSARKYLFNGKGEATTEFIFCNKNSK